MSDKDQKAAQKVEAQPLKPLPTPEYRYQVDQTFSGSLDHSLGDSEKKQNEIDLSGVSLNFT